MTEKKKRERERERKEGTDGIFNEPRAK